MAGDWIKVETATPLKSEIDDIMEHCRVSRGEAFLAWFILWSWLDSATDDGFLPRCTRERIDERSRLPSMASALEIAGWLIVEDHGCTIVNWHRHNGQSAKKRAEDARRKAHGRKLSENPPTKD